jgi:biopolymer transport protein ExbD
MRRRRARRTRKPAELLLVPMIDIFTVLVTFLLMTAVFSRITILELDLPSSQSADASAPVLRLEVIVRKQGLELTNGTQRIAAIPNVNDGYDLATLTRLAASLKRDHPEANAASVLLEPDIAYDHLIQVMDAIRSTNLAPEEAAQQPDAPPVVPGNERPVRVALFSDIAVGDAP